MRRANDSQALKKLAELLKSAPEDPLEQVLRHGRSVPEYWRQQTLADMARRLRRRLDMTQRQVAALAGLPHSKVSKIEAGQDVQISTLCQLFAGFGCGLVILPLSRLSAEELWRRTHALCDDGHIRRRRRYPRK